MSVPPIVEPITLNLNTLLSYTEDERLIANGNTIQTDIHQTCCDIFTFMLCCMCPHPPCSCCCSHQAKSERLAVEKFTVYFGSTYGKISELAQEQLKISLKNRKYLLTSDACKLIKYAEERRKINKASQNAVINPSANTDANSSSNSNSTKNQTLTITISPANVHTATIGESAFTITSPITESSLPGSNSPSILPMIPSEMDTSPTLTPLSSQSPESPPPSRHLSKWPMSQGVSLSSINNLENRHLSPTPNQTPNQGSNQVLAHMPRSPNPNSGPRVARTEHSAFHSELNINSLPTISE